MQSPAPMSFDPRSRKANIRTEAYARARAEIANRIRRVCTGLTEAEFEELVDGMAGVQCKYEQMAGDPTSLNLLVQFLAERTAGEERGRIS